MRDLSLNPFVPNLGQSFEPPVYDSSASFPKHWCQWCGCEGDIVHEQTCNLNPCKSMDNKLNNNLCGGKDLHSLKIDWQLIGIDFVRLLFVVDVFILIAAILENFGVHILPF